MGTNKGQDFVARPLSSHRNESQIEDLTERVGQINVDNNLTSGRESRRLSDVENRPNDPEKAFLDFDMGTEEQNDSNNLKPKTRLASDGYNTEDWRQFDEDAKQRQPMGRSKGHILIVTNLDRMTFSDQIMKEKFESLFTSYDAKIQFRYLKSFRRVRLDFSDDSLAETARLNLDGYKLGSSAFRCYLAQMIKPRVTSNIGSAQEESAMDDEDNNDDISHSNETTMYLRIPKPTKQFLISPPASPPVGWEPVTENTPSMDVQLLSALANLVPGQAHELHAATESQPGIFVEVCEEPQFPPYSNNNNSTSNQRVQMPRTANPMVTQSMCFN